MSEAQGRQTLSRRGFLRLAAAGGAAAGGYVLYERAPWLNYEQQAAAVRQPMAHSEMAPAHWRELVRYATLAASGHNTQPWRFTIADDAITIAPDYARRVPVVDPHDRELWISLGCALENMRVSAQAMGYEPEVTYPDAAERIHVRLAAGTTRRDGLFDAIPLRQNTRSLYDGRPISVANLAQLQTLPVEPGVALQFISEPAERERVLEYVRAGAAQQYEDSAYLRELIGWLRFNRREALAAGDGLFTVCSGNPELPRWLGQRFVLGTQPGQQADADAAKLRSSPAIVLIASAEESPTAWVRTGQVYERMALATTALNIRSAFLNQPIEVPHLRTQFRSAMALGGLQPQLLIRLGYAATMPFSSRRPVGQVIVEAE